MSNPTSSLLPPNASALERNLEQVTTRLDALPVPVREQWNPDTCPLERLPFLAWALSVDSWQPSWPEAVKRQILRDAVNIQRHKGTAQSVRDVVAAFGAGLALVEWWQKTPAGTPHTFEVVLTVGSSVPATSEYQQNILDEISRTKPVRSHFTLIAGLSLTGGLGLQGAARPLTYTRLNFSEA
ncbi:phage tail protein I [Motiliproteus sp.]|uniref:phage tail protein I n=1 Tax=Motiliproteus sp. TaxID=1898955 RepID=UPI003BAACE6C